MRRQGFSPESASAASRTDPAGARILTGPRLRLRVGVLIRHSPVPPASVYRDLDAVVISHAHLDHLDVPSLRLIDKETPVFAPRATKRLIKRLGFAHVTEMEAGESRDIGGVRLTATPAVHGITRHPMAVPGNTLGYLVQGRLTAYFAGDTGLFDEMAGLTDHLDLALLPVSGWGPWLPPAFNAKFGAWPVAFTRYAAHLAPGVEVRVLAPGETTRIDAAGREAAARGLPPTVDAVALVPRSPHTRRQDLP